MDGNSSLERRYSFNMAQGNPVAESTHLNGSSFSWGTSMSPNHRSNSSFCLNNIHTTLDGNNRSIAVSPKSKNVSKIDARIAADVQSKGLASRIVKYHESGTRLNRSMSAHNLYTKPGQFPVVTLKKTDLPYRATKQELSMIRIPPPEKSSFYGNTISSLLRSSSVVGLQSKRTEDLSRENRPIIHPPPTEDDMAPTRSVLDVLKEISRKRINSDDLDADETSKKYCNRAANDLVDTGNNTATVNSPSFTTSSSLSCQRYKRQRDCITPHQSVQMAETKTSPEQAKKRVCNYNNDITSSLSSSIKCKPHGSAKRISVSHNLNQTMPTNVESYEIQKAKMQRYLDNHNNDKNNTRVDVRFENLENNLRKLDTIKPITPIPATPGTQDQQCNIGGVPPKRTVSEPLYNPERKIAINSIQPANKPRLTLFNKKCDDEESTAANESSETVAENVNDFDECAGIPFVKPKKISSISGLRNPVIERTQKSKLALMLSGLRGELYQNSDADELDSSKEKTDKTAEIKINTSTSAVTSSLKSTTITTLTTVTSSSNVGTPITSSTLNLSTNNKTTSSMPSLNASINKTSSPLVGLKLSQPSSENVTSTINNTNNNVSKSTEGLSISNVPVLGGFTFGTNNTTTSSSPMVNTTTSVSAPKDSKTLIATTSSIPTTTSNVLNFGSSTQSSSSASDDTNKLKANIQPSAGDNSLQLRTVGTAFTLSTNSTSASSNTTNSLKTTNAFTFGTNVAATASASSAPNQVSGLTLLNNTGKTNNAFNFTVPSTSSSATTPLFSTLTSANPQTSTTTTTSGLTFGAVAASTNSTASTSSFTFNASKPTATTETTTISSGGGGNSSLSFTFDSNTIPPVPTFGTNTNTGIKTQTTSSGFSFNSDTKIQNSSLVDQNKSTVVKQTETNIFNFGSPSLKAPSTTAGSAPIFGNVSNSTSQTTSLFGSNAVKASTPTFGSSIENKSATIATNSVFGAASSNSSTPTFGSSVENKSAPMAATSIFGAASSNSSTPTFGSSTENKSSAMATASAFGGGSSNSSTSTPFSFGSKPAIAQTTNTNNNNNNNNTAAGGFSFGSVAANSSDNGPFAFGIKTGGTTNTANNSFGSASSSAPQNKNFTFGSSANKQDNPPSVFGGGVNKPTENMATPGGFSFGSAMSPKATTFNFGAGGNSFPGNAVSNTNSPATGFSFGGATALKPNDVSTNKPFSFGTPQPSQQQQHIVANNNANSSNIFGSTASTKTVPPPAFNFNSGSSTNTQSNTPTTNNIFAPPSSSTITTGPGDRPIRRATRRLQK